MADGTSGAEAPRRAYGTIVVIGGGCYGGYYLRQLRRAAAKGALCWRDLILVDRDPACAVSEAVPHDDGPAAAPSARLVVAEWGAFLDQWLPQSGADDALVPSPLMPHLAYEWLARRASARWPDRPVARAPLGGAVGTPWESAAPDGTAYLSHAAWTCPVNCIEPARCPHTRGPRDWSMPATLATWTERARAAGPALLGPFTFHCTHRAYGVGMVDVAALLAADAAIAAAGTQGALAALIATASHCHGAAALLTVGAPVPPTGPVGEISPVRRH
jgi:hypothetical protein